ncbi:MAG: ester cyclase [Pseudomonadota bacterium]
MRGFDPKFKDPTDYILGITKEIWEDRGVHRIRDYYAEDGPVRSPSGIVTGSEAVIAATLATLTEFPDRQLFGEDVIWSDDNAGGFLSSHRITSTATHTTAGIYGEATSKVLRYRIIADCACRDNQVYDEWLIRDQGAIVRQLGIQPKHYAAERINAEGGPDHAAKPFAPDTDVAGAYHGHGNDHAVGARYAEILTRIMNAELRFIPEAYDRAAQIELPGGRTDYGHGGADRFWMALRATLPQASFAIEHIIGREDALMPPRAACRWSLQGRHDGPGMFGPASGADVHVMGMSHAEFGPRGLRREWILIDETAIWKQILLKTG